MPDKQIVPLFRYAHEFAEHDPGEPPVSTRQGLLESLLTNEELLERIPHQTKCLGALSVIAEMNHRIKNLRAASTIQPEL